MELRSMISGEDVVAAVKTFIDDVSDGSAVGRGTVDETVILICYLAGYSI
jgi:hypothetical protein